MKLFSIAKYMLALAAIVYLFIDWRISIALFILATIFHAIPFGPNLLLSCITGYLILGGVVCLFFKWQIGIGLVIAGVLVAKFRIWGNKVNAEHYNKSNSKDLADK